MNEAIDENTNSEIEGGRAIPAEEAGNAITENTNSAGADLGGHSSAKATLEELCAATLRRRGRRGRPKGSGRKHPENCSPKTFRNFSPLAQALLIAIRLTGPEYMEQSEAEIVEEALVRLGQSLSNRNPQLAARLRKAGR